MTELAAQLDHEAQIGPCPAGRAGLAAKRVVDVLGAGTVLMLTAPLMAVLALLIRLDSKGPCIYRASRLGFGGKPITVFKFRSMVSDADQGVHRDYLLKLLAEDPDAGDDLYKVKDDPRITRVGRFLRRTSLDELPQLVNVLRGEMSLVGPRPEVPYVLEAYEPWMYRRFGMPPGLTGLWQIRGRGALPPREMLRLDAEYVDTWSWWQDLHILAVTPFRVFSRGSTS
ncbi:MAG: sugar transferase [Acidimicrobiales bacterium]|nr:sugar transferase [Acidimicrobiales bacterium]